MKRGALIAAIDAAPTVYGHTILGNVALQKGSFKDRLKERFPGRADETGFRLDEEGVIRSDPE